MTQPSNLPTYSLRRYNLSSALPNDTGWNSSRCRYNEWDYMDFPLQRVYRYESYTKVPMVRLASAQAWPRVT